MAAGRTHASDAGLAQTALSSTRATVLVVDGEVGADTELARGTPVAAVAADGGALAILTVLVLVALLVTSSTVLSVRVQGEARLAVGAPGGVGGALTNALTTDAAL